ncbi:MAG: hypothetical protein WB810_00920, partial [Candidatus Cybelea sp.]
MRGPARIDRFVIAAAFAGLTACTAPGVSVPAGITQAMQSQAARPHSTAQQVYISDRGANAVFI